MECFRHKQVTIDIWTLNNEFISILSPWFLEELGIVDDLFSTTMHHEILLLE